MLSISWTIFLFTIIFTTPIPIVSILLPLIPIPLLFSSLTSIFVMLISIILSFLPSRIRALLLLSLIVWATFSFILPLPILILLRTIFILLIYFLPLWFILSVFFPLFILAFIVRFAMMLLFYSHWILLFLFLYCLNCWSDYLWFLLFLLWSNLDYWLFQFLSSCLLLFLYCWFISDLSLIISFIFEISFIIELHCCLVSFFFLILIRPWSFLISRMHLYLHLVLLVLFFNLWHITLYYFRFVKVRWLFWRQSLVNLNYFGLLFEHFLIEST